MIYIIRITVYNRNSGFLPRIIRREETVMSKKLGSYLSLVVMFALGLVLILNPYWVVNTGIKLVGIALILYGLGAVISTLMQQNFKATVTAGMVGNILIAILGVVMLFNSYAISHLFNVFFGVIIVLHGVSILLDALNKKDSGDKWYIPVIIAGVIILFGVLLILRVFGIDTLMIRVAGIIMLFNAALGLWVALKN